ncbi:hypothetical protein OS493_013420 [Desmophyllum pertusum]|uniref:Uncharacterized protein n=1 Tax=Desmophyllum pertusum TaxID=174260 RepID=A0A9X0CF01_9CNID|nr:hypothetical protein OS493_013420 [Desmophyllum pertusum]
MAENVEDAERQLQAEIDNEIEKLKYYLEETDELIEEGDFVEIEVVMSQRQKEIEDESERKKADEQRVRELERQEEFRDQERQMWQEKFNAEL